MSGIVGVDPGRTTGLARLSPEREWEGREASTLLEVWQTLCLWVPDRIIMESFVGGMGREAAYPLAIIGVVRLYCEMHSTPMVEQSPAVQAHYRSQTPSLHPSKHVRSAIAHILYATR